MSGGCGGNKSGASSKSSNHKPAVWPKPMMAAKGANKSNSSIQGTGWGMPKVRMSLGGKK